MASRMARPTLFSWSRVLWTICSRDLNRLPSQVHARLLQFCLTHRAVHVLCHVLPQCSLQHFGACAMHVALCEL